MLDCLINGIPGVMLGLPKDLPVHCAEKINMESEYRVFVVNGEIRAICHYKGDPNLKIDLDIVKQSVKTLNESDEGRQLTGMGMDFAVMLLKDGSKITCLVEVNDGYSLGWYHGLSGKDYTDLLIARWRSLVNN